MTNEELLVAMTGIMSDMLDEKLDTKLDEKLDQKLDEKLDQKLDEKLNPIKADISGLKERMTNVELLLENYVVPSLQDLCKVVNTEYKKYEISIESHEQMKTDTDVLKSVVSDHSERIIRLEKMNGLSSVG